MTKPRHISTGSTTSIARQPARPADILPAPVAANPAGATSGNVRREARRVDGLSVPTPADRRVAARKADSIAEDGPEGAEATATSVIRRLRVVMRALQGHSRAVEQACGVSATALWALWEIDRAGGLRANDLARRLAVHPSTVSNLLDRLESVDCIRRSRGRNDQRVVCVEATDTGRELLAKAPGEPQGLLLAAINRLNEGQREALLASLDELIGRLPPTAVDDSRQLFNEQHVIQRGGANSAADRRQNKVRRCGNDQLVDADAG